MNALRRDQDIQLLHSQTWDLLIIGGGVTGAGIALDAASRGLKTALLEKHDFSGGTSSRSTKLIHGGLRYLKQFEFKLVHEVGTERAIVHRNARHVVKPERMLLPIVEGGSLGKFMTSMGLWVYDFLAGVKKEERRKMLSKEDTLLQEPLLRGDVLKGGGLYFEYRTDDARLTIEILKSAVEKGAVALNYAGVTDFLYEQGNIVGVKYLDALSGMEHELKARRVVNAAGPWVDNLRRLDRQDPEAARPKKRLHLTKGVHLVVPKERLPLQQSAYFDTPGDGRMIFAIPRGEITYIGTTDTNYSGSTENPHATQEDVEYILSATNHTFPGMKLQASDIISTWAGLRPLIHEDGKDPSELSRKDEIFISSTGLISIAGGKLTGYRKMAQRITDLVCKALGNRNECLTKTLQVSGAAFDSDEALAKFVEIQIGEAKQLNIPHKLVADLVSKYGSNTGQIIEKAYECFPGLQDGRAALLEAEVWYGVEHEMCQSLSDYLIRRTGRLYFERQHLEGYYQKVATAMAKQLGWSEQKRLQEISDFEAEYRNAVVFKH